MFALGLAGLDLFSLSARGFTDATVCNGRPRLREADPGVHAFGLKSGFAPPIRLPARVLFLASLLCLLATLRARSRFPCGLH